MVTWPNMVSFAPRMVVTAAACDAGIQVNLSPDRAADASYLWDRLSVAAHYHAYELAPT
jgi:hypothetical protein